MATPWIILDRRYSSSVRNPTSAQLAEAIAELYHENAPGMTEADYAEHSTASLRYGFDDGPVYVISVSRAGVVTLEEWADQDFENELHPPRVRNAVPEKEALDVWKQLAWGKIEVAKVLVEMGPARLMK